MQAILELIDRNQDENLSELIEFLKIPSISSQEDHNQDTLNAAEFVYKVIKSSGIKQAEIIETEGHPIVYAEWCHLKDAPTVLIYGHYDVQPAEPLELWHTPPFEPRIENGKIYGRGTSDDKGQLFAHLKAIAAIMKVHKGLPVNVKILIEGEEECGSDNLDKFILSNKEKLSCDAVLISDTEWFAEGLPSICYSLRGISYVELELTGPNRDLHSGTFGGAVDNPINALASIIAKLKDEYGRITIPGFYDDVLLLSREERNAFKRLPFKQEEYNNDLDVNSEYGEFGYSTLERVWGRPSLDVNGIIGGYTESGAKTVLPSKASAKVSMRLVPNQNNEDISKKFVAHIKELVPPTMKLNINVLHGGDPVLIPLESKAIKAGLEALKEAFNLEPVFMREGGSIPIVGVFQKELQAEVVLMGLGLPGDNIHSPNENMDLGNFFGGIKASALFFDKYSKM